MKCPFCSTENEGKFCQNCGAQLVPDEGIEQASAEQQPNEQTDNQFGEQPNEPIYGDPYSGDYPQRIAHPDAGIESNAPKRNRTAITISAIVAGTVAVVAVAFCVIVCTMFNRMPEIIAAQTAASAAAESSDYAISYDYDGIYYDEEEYNEDSDSMLAYEDSTAYDGVKIVSVADGFYEKYETAVSDSGEVTVEVPAQIDGKDVVEIESLPIYIDTAESVKLILPDTVKVIRAYALSFTDNLTEVQFGSGLVSIGDSAFIDNVSLTEVTIPSNVTNLEACGLGIHYDENGTEQKISGFTIHGEKGSAAETYATQYGFTFKETE